MVYQLRYYDDLLEEECFIQSPQMLHLSVIGSELLDQPARYREVVLQRFKDKELAKFS
jgi:hypothetical protein